MPSKRKVLSRPKGIYVYCSDDEKDRIKAVAKRLRRSLTGYVMDRLMTQLEADEKRLGIKGR